MGIPSVSKPDDTALLTPGLALQKRTVIFFTSADLREAERFQGCPSQHQAADFAHSRQDLLKSFSNMRVIWSARPFNLLEDP